MSAVAPSAGGKETDSEGNPLQPTSVRVTNPGRDALQMNGDAAGTRTSTGDRPTCSHASGESRKSRMETSASGGSVTSCTDAVASATSSRTCGSSGASCSARRSTRNAANDWSGPFCSSALTWGIAMPRTHWSRRARAQRIPPPASMTTTRTARTAATAWRRRLETSGRCKASRSRCTSSRSPKQFLGGSGTRCWGAFASARSRIRSTARGTSCRTERRAGGSMSSTARRGEPAAGRPNAGVPVNISDRTQPVANTSARARPRGHL